MELKNVDHANITVLTTECLPDLSRSLNTCVPFISRNLFTVNILNYIGTSLRIFDSQSNRRVVRFKLELLRFWWSSFVVQVIDKSFANLEYGNEAG